MPTTTKAKTKTFDEGKLTNLADGLRDYVTCTDFAVWLMQNDILPATADPHELAHGFAVKFNRSKEPLEAAIEQAWK
jgi:hypothetical protein